MAHNDEFSDEEKMREALTLMESAAENLKQALDEATDVLRTICRQTDAIAGEDDPELKSSHPSYPR